MEIVFQKLTSIAKDEFALAKKIYGLIFVSNDIHMKGLELELIAFIATRGTVSSPPLRDEFINKYDSSKGTLYNMLSRLQKKNILQKIQGKTRLNPLLQLDLSKESFRLEINIKKEALIGKP